MSLITPFVICLSVGLAIGLAFGFGRISATLHLLRNPPNKRIEIQRLKIGPVTIPWPEPFIYEPPQLQEAPAGEEEKLPGGLTSKTTGGRPPTSYATIAERLSYLFGEQVTIDQTMEFLRQAEVARQTSRKEFLAFCKARKDIPESTVRGWIEKMGLRET